jgi:alpha-L-rhamnosidase
MLKNGATTLWEHWPDGASHIHYFMGFVDNFLIRHVAGINSNAAHPGFGVIDVEPKLIEGISHAEASYNSIHGLIQVDWKKNSNGTILLNLQVPVNCTAKVILPELVRKIAVDGVSQKMNHTQLPGQPIQAPKKFITVASGIYHIQFE